MSSNSNTTLSLADISSDTVAALWCRIYGYLPDKAAAKSLIVCKTFLQILPALIKHVNYPTPAFSQQSFEAFTGRYSCLETLYIDLEYDEGLDMLDWTEVSLPKLQYLGLSCCPIKSIHFTHINTPSLRSLSISNQGPREAEEIVLDLQHLTSLDFEHTHVKDGSGFAASLSACPKLQRFSSYKLWGIGDHHQRLHLPECGSLNLYRSGDLEWLEVHAPKLMSLNLQACYSCEHVRLFPKEGPPVSVNFVNANIGRKSLKHLAQHPRVGMENMHGNNDEDDDIGGMLGDYPPPNMAGMMGGAGMMDGAGMMGGAMAEVFANIMGNPGMGGGYPGNYDEEEEGSDHEEGAAPGLDNAQLMQMLAMMQQAAYGAVPGHGPYGAADEEDEDEEEEEEEEEEEGSQEDPEGNEQEQQ